MTGTRVLYLGGMGRSGSTVLERAVAQLPGACGVGEVAHLWERGIRNNERCGCGESFHDCPFWTKVGDAAFGGWGEVDVDRVLRLARSVDDVKYVPAMALRPGRRRRRLISEYVDHYERLYAAITEVSGAEVVVDSSKFTSLAYLLRSSPRLQVRMVHILRDPRGVAHSWTKVVRRPEVSSEVAYMPTYSPAYMALLYDGHNALLELLALRGMPTTRVRYEDFAADPLAVVARVAAFAGLPFDEEQVRGDGPRTLWLDTVHTVSGNPSRFTSGDVAVRLDEKWRTDMAPRDRRVVGALTVPVRARYGYLAKRPT